MKVNQHGAARCTACCHLQAAAAARADEHWESEQISARKIQPQAGRQAGQKKQLSRVRPAAAASLAADDRRPCHSGERKTPKWRSFSRGKQQEKRLLEMEYFHRFFTRFSLCLPDSQFALGRRVSVTDALLVASGRKVSCVCWERSATASQLCSL